MAGEDTVTLTNGTVNVTTIIPPKKIQNEKNGHVIGCDTNGKICKTDKLSNGKVLDITTVENGKLMLNGDNDEKSSLHTEFDEIDVSCGWGPCRPQWLQFFATKQAFLVTFCLTWVSFNINFNQKCLNITQIINQ